jgi:hypothetical protein
MFATKGFMLALHVPASFAKDKNRLTRSLYRIGKSGVVIDVKKEWTFIHDIRQFGINNTQQQITKTTPKTDNIQGSTTMDYDINNEGKKVIDNNNEDPIRIIKRRLAKGEISKEEYEELRKAIEL